MLGIGLGLGLGSARLGGRLDRAVLAELGGGDEVDGQDDLHVLLLGLGLGAGLGLGLELGLG